MRRETVIDNEFGSMWYYPEKRIIHHQIHKFMFGETYKKFILTATDLMKKYQARKWLSDDRKSPVIRKEDMLWEEVNWFPQTVDAGWKYWAIVTPEKALGQMNMEGLARQFASQGLIVRFFNSPEEGLKWLESQKD